MARRVILRAFAETGLRLFPSDRRAAVRAGVLAVTAVTLWIVAIDAGVFRQSLVPAYIAHYNSPLVPRTMLAVAGSVGEELLYRLIAMTAIAALPLLAGKRPGAGWMIFAIAAAQAVNVLGLVMALPLYATLRFWVPGLVWGWLYWRHGFATALVSHMAIHPVLDPLLRAAI